MNYAYSFDLNIIHVNDIHAHFEEVSAKLGRCHQNEPCYGGTARLATKIKELNSTTNSNHTIFLNAGDYYQGTIWYSILKYDPVVTMANLLNYTAYALGNHDFDDGVSGLLPFLNQVNFPVLAANLNATKFPKFQEKILPSITLNIGGTLVGVIGYITPKTSYISQPGPDIEFLDEIHSIKLECKKLKDKGVNILIALGHSGYNFDKTLAREVPDLDVIVGGHSHSFLYTGENPPDHSEGPYPTYITNPSGKIVPVVQAGSYSKYVGYMQLKFDDSGNLKSPVNGIGVSFAKPFLLDESIPKDEKILKAMAPYVKELEKYRKIIGFSNVFLNRSSKKECNLGDLFANAIKDYPWHDIDISFVGTGELRSVGNCIWFITFNHGKIFRLIYYQLFFIKFMYSNNNYLSKTNEINPINK